MEEIELADYLVRGTTVPNSDSVPLLDFVEILFRGRRMMIILLVVLIGGAGTWLSLSPTTFDADMTFLVKNDRSDVVITPGQTMGLQGRQWIDENQLNTEIQLLSSRQLLRGVVERCGLATDSRSSRKPSPLDVDNAVNDLQNSITITPVLKANMIKVGYSAADPKEAARVLETLADAYLDLDLKVHSSIGTYEFFHQQTLVYQDRLRSAQEQLTAFQTPGHAEMLGQQKELILRKLVDLQAALGEAEASGAENTRRMQDLRTQIDGATPRVQTQTRRLPNQYSAEHLTALVTDLQNKRTELLARLLPNDRNVRQLEEQIANTQATLDREKDGAATEVASDLNPIRQAMELDLAKVQASQSGVNGRINAVKAQIEAYQGRLRDLEKSTAGYDELVRFQKEAEENYLLYSKKQEEARIAEALDRQRIGNLALVDPPRVPLTPHKKLTKNTAAAILLGILLIPAFTLTLGAFRNTVYSSTELEALTGLPVLAAVPYDKKLLTETAHATA